MRALQDKRSGGALFNLELRQFFCIIYLSVWREVRQSDHSATSIHRNSRLVMHFLLTGIHSHDQITVLMRPGEQRAARIRRRKTIHSWPE